MGVTYFGKLMLGYILGLHREFFGMLPENEKSNGKEGGR